MNKKKEISIQVIGSGCPTCKTLYEKVLAVAKNIDENLEVEYINDVTKLIELGVMTSPAFVINGEIISAGQFPEDEEIKSVIKAHL